MNVWTDIYQNVMFQIHGFAFLSLGAIAFVFPKHHKTFHFTPQLNWLASFAILHGLSILFYLQYIDYPACWLNIACQMLMLTSFALLLEFGRRCLNASSYRFRLPALPLYALVFSAVTGSALLGSEPLLSLEVGWRYVIGAPAALLASFALTMSRREFQYSCLLSIAPNFRCPDIAAASLAAYGLFILIPSVDSPYLPRWLPDENAFYQLTGMPLQLPRMLCALLMALSFALLARNDRRITYDHLMRVLNTLNGFVYRCHNDRHWTMQFISDGVERLTGFPAEAFLSQGRVNLGELIHAGDAERIRHEVQAALTARRNFEFGYRIHTRNGETRWVYEFGRGVHDDQGALIYIEGQVIDDTLRRQAETSLHIKNAAIDASINAIAIADLDTKLSYVNQAFVDLWRLPSVETALGRSPFEFLADPAEAQQVIDRLFSQGCWQGDLLAKRHDQSTIDVQLSGYMAKDESGAPLCMIGIFSDISARNQAQRELKRQRDFADNLINTAPVIVLLLAPDGSIQHVNPYFEQLTGYRLNEIKHKNWFATFLPKRDQERIRGLFEGAMANKTASGNINPIVIRNGEERQIEWHDRLMRDDQGSISGLLVIGQDVTERIKTNAALLRRDAELDQFKQTLDRTLDSVFMFDANTLQFSYCNQGAIDHLGYTREELLNMHPYDLKPEFSETQFRTFITPLLSGERDRLTFESLHRHKDGRQIPVDIMLQYIKPPQLAPRFVSVVRDISKRKRAEQELKRLNRDLEQRVIERTAELERQSHRNAFIVEAAMDGFFTADFQGRIRSCNDAYCDMLGYTREELLSLNIPTIEAIETEEQIEARICKIIEQGHDRFDTRHRRKDGSLVDVAVNVTMKELDGNRQFFAFVNDISERKRAEALLIKAREEAEQANQAKSEFLSRMSHELRTPLNAILGFGQLLESDPNHPLSEIQSDNIREILHAGDHLLALINEVLDLSRIESGHIDINLESIRIAPAIEACVKQISPLAEQRNIRIMIDLKNDCTVVADAMRLQEVLLNLLSNAVKYNRTGGRIDIRCAPAEAQRVRIEIQDTGLGIPAEFLPRLFQPFERLESAYRGVEGTGIGLALAKKLVQVMQGEIGVETQSGEGSCFWFVLPSGQETAAAVEKINPPLADGHTEANDKRHKLLYIEDNPTNLRLAQKILANRVDLELLSAVNAKSGLEMAEQMQPDLILLDLNLPDMDGFDVLDQLKNSFRTQNIPVVAVTANAMSSDIERGMASGLSDYLTKPFDVSKFLHVIDQSLQHTPAKN